MKHLLFMSFLMQTACLGMVKSMIATEDDPEEEEEESERQEGQRQGDCTDGEDNDEDGDIDCADSGCFDKPACSDDTATAEPSWEPSTEPSSEPSIEPSSEPSNEQNVLYITQGYAGTATVVPGDSYVGTETFVQGNNPTAGTGVLETEHIWDASGTPVEAPTDCGNCVFAFDIQLSFDAAASTDPNGSGADVSFSYAMGDSSYGSNTLFYGSGGSWSPWIYDGNSNTDPAGVTHTQTVQFQGSSFTYDSIITDYYYAY